MSDALAGNQQDSILVLVLLCLVHARRQFFEIKEFYPEVCEPVLEAIRQVYKHEREIQDLQLDAAARLLYHQQNPRRQNSVGFSKSMISSNFSPSSES